MLDMILCIYLSNIYCEFPRFKASTVLRLISVSAFNSHYELRIVLSSFYR